ncbi:hypothetical protein [Pedobacter sp.]
MKENEILIKAADTLDESITTLKISTTETIIKRVPKHSFWGFEWGIEEIEEILPKTEILKIRPATLRTMVRISKLLVGMEVGTTPESSADYIGWALGTVCDNGEVQAKIIATAIHNQKSEVPDTLIELILDNFTAEDLWNVMQIVLDKLNIIPFMNTITSVKSVQVLKTEKVSPTETEEIIASGEQSEVLQSILGSASITF